MNKDTRILLHKAGLASAFASEYKRGRIEALRDAMALCTSDDRGGRYINGSDAATKIYEVLKREEAAWIPLTRT